MDLDISFVKREKSLRLFSKYRGKLGLVLIDIILINLVLYLTLNFRYGVGWSNHTSSQFIKSMVPYTICLVLTFYFF